MKKILLAIVLLSATNITTVLADYPVILHPTNKGNAANNPNKHKSPISIPEVLIEGHTLSFEESCIGCSITIIDENENTVFSAIVGEEGIVILPDSLVGTFVLELERESITFEGEIEL